jgi:HAMP domain-containing protein
MFRPRGKKMKVKSLVILGLTMLTCLGLIASAAGSILLQGRVQVMSQQYQTQASDVLKAQIGESMETSAGTVLSAVEAALATKAKQVTTWTVNEDLQSLLVSANDMEKEALFAAWSDSLSRTYGSDGYAQGDGSPYNDVSPAVSLWLNDLMSRYGFKHITITDARGYVVAATSVTPQFDYGAGNWALVKNADDTISMVRRATEGAGALWWSKAKNSGASSYTTPYGVDDATLMSGVAVCIPVYGSSSNEVIGVVRAFTTLDSTFKEAIASTSGAAEADNVKIVDNNGLVVYSTEGKNGAKSVAALTSFTNAATGTNGYVIENDEAGSEKLIGYSADASEGLICLVSTAPAKAYAPVSNLSAEMGVVNTQFVETVNTQTIALIGGEVAISAVVLIGFITILNKKLTNPISDMAKAIGKVKEGDLNISVEAEGDNEISDLGKALNQMILSLRLTAANIDMEPRSGDSD